MNDNPILILDTGETICLSETRVYMRLYGKSEKIRDVEKNTKYFVSTMNLLISQSDNYLRIEKILNTKQVLPVTTLPVKTDLPLFFFFTKNLLGQTIVFTSHEVPANSSNDSKSVHYKVTLLDDEVDIKKFSTIEMLRIINYDQIQETILLRELYPFLQEKMRVYDWKKDATIVSKSPKNEDFPALFSPSQEEIPESSGLLGRYSTRIKKRVYNCFDFSESSQITLRSCKLEL
ncbi:hypothetical protein IT418_02745 [bacterium]|nr:hypothetical protein [bacterium]